MDHATARLAEDVKDIVHTRTAIAEKLGLIEHRLTETVEEAKQTANEFVERTQATLAGAVDSVKALGAPAEAAAKNPWIMLAGSVALGYAIGVALRPARRPTAVSTATASENRAAMQNVMKEAVAPTMDTLRSGAHPAMPPSSTGTRPTRMTTETPDGFVGAVRQVATEQLDNLRAELVEVAKTVALEWIKQSLRSATRTVIDSAHERTAPRADRADRPSRTTV